MNGWVFSLDSSSPHPFCFPTVLTLSLLSLSSYPSVLPLKRRGEVRWRNYDEKPTELTNFYPLKGQPILHPIVLHKEAVFHFFWWKSRLLSGSLWGLSGLHWHQPTAMSEPMVWQLKISEMVVFSPMSSLCGPCSPASSSLPVGLDEMIGSF